MNYARCWDGLPLVPVEWEDCPLGSFVPSCIGSEAGELCEANGECSTPENLRNCEGKSIYRKANGTTRTSTTSTASTTFTTTVSTTTATGAFAFGAVIGPCTLSGACVQSPNYPFDYQTNEGCEVLLNESSMATFSESGCLSSEFYIDGDRYQDIRRRRYSGNRVMVESSLRFVPTGQLHQEFVISTHLMPHQLIGAGRRRRRDSCWGWGASTWRICLATAEGEGLRHFRILPALIRVNHMVITYGEIRVSSNFQVDGRLLQKVQRQAAQDDDRTKCIAGDAEKSSPARDQQSHRQQNLATSRWWPSGSSLLPLS